MKPPDYHDDLESGIDYYELLRVGERAMEEEILAAFRIRVRVVHRKLEPGRVYRTRDFATWTKNTSRFARRLERAGGVQRQGHGLFAHPRVGRFGAVPASDP